MTGNDAASNPCRFTSGAAPYWTSWTHTDGNKRLTETQHAASATNNTINTYGYPAATASAPTPPHAPTKVTRKVGTATAVDHALTYDAAGRTKTGPLDWSLATLTYDTEGRLATVARAGKTSTANVYDAEGNLLIKGELNGTRTLMLGDTQVTYTPATGAKTSKRLYSFEGQIVAVRTGTGTAGLYFTPPGAQGTAQLQVNASTQAVTKRYYTPYGDDRKSVTGWQSLGGFLGASGATTDPLSNLTHLGARDYDPNLGRFLTPDPLLVPGDPRQLPAYQYGANDPVNNSDPSGLVVCADSDCTMTAQLPSNGKGKPKFSGTNNISAQDRAHNAAAAISGKYGTARPPSRITKAMYDSDAWAEPLDKYNDCACKIGSLAYWVLSYTADPKAAQYIWEHPGEFLFINVVSAGLGDHYDSFYAFPDSPMAANRRMVAQAMGAEGIAQGAQLLAAGNLLRSGRATSTAAKSTPELASGLERTGTALSKSDPFHRSVSWVVDNPAAQRFAIKGGDGVSRELYQLPGEVNGKSGVFEWIIDRSGTNPVINHQRFIPGGSITGSPNQVVP